MDPEGGSSHSAEDAREPASPKAGGGSSGGGAAGVGAAAVVATSDAAFKRTRNVPPDLGTTLADDAREPRRGGGKGAGSVGVGETAAAGAGVGVVGAAVAAGTDASTGTVITPLPLKLSSLWSLLRSVRRPEMPPLVRRADIVAAARALTAIPAGITCSAARARSDPAAAAARC